MPTCCSNIIINSSLSYHPKYFGLGDKLFGHPTYTSLNLHSLYNYYDNNPILERGLMNEGISKPLAEGKRNMTLIVKEAIQ